LLVDGLPAGGASLSLVPANAIGFTAVDAGVGVRETRYTLDGGAEMIFVAPFSLGDSGRRSVLRFDNNTQVIYRQRSYPVSNLERGDYVAARVQQDRDGRLLTTSISVRETAQDRGMGASIGNRLDRTEGRVESIDTRRGTFEIRDQRNRIVVISVTFNAPRTVTDRFNRLRSGDYVRIEGRSVNSDRFDLENFQ
jgi:exosome complex RNA-binding protein Csl4